MKLYATVTSERASKGQGGKELTINLKCGNLDRGNIFNLELKSQGNGATKYDCEIVGLNGNIVFLRSLRAKIGQFEEGYIKGEKQKTA